MARPSSGAWLSSNAGWAVGRRSADAPIEIKFRGLTLAVPRKVETLETCRGKGQNVLKPHCLKDGRPHNVAACSVVLYLFLSVWRLMQVAPNRWKPTVQCFDNSWTQFRTPHVQFCYWLWIGVAQHHKKTVGLRSWTLLNMCGAKQKTVWAPKDRSNEKKLLSLFWFAQMHDWTLQNCWNHVVCCVAGMHATTKHANWQVQFFALLHSPRKPLFHAFSTPQGLVQNLQCAGTHWNMHHVLGPVSCAIRFIRVEMFLFNTKSDWLQCIAAPPWLDEYCASVGVAAWIKIPSNLFVDSESMNLVS